MNPAITARVSLDGGAPETGAVDAALTDVATFSVASLAGVDSLRYELISYPPAFATPAGWTLGSDGVIYYVGTTPPNVTLAPWGKWILRVTANGGTRLEAGTGNEIDDPTLVSEIGVRVASPNGVHDIASQEETQFDPARGWTGDQQGNLRLLEEVLATGGVAGVASLTVGLDTLTGAIALAGGTGIGLSKVPMQNSIAMTNTGLVSIAKSGSSAITGAATLSAGANITLNQTANNIEIVGTGGGGGGVTSLAKSGDTALTGVVTVSATSPIIITRSSQDLGFSLNAITNANVSNSAAIVPSKLSDGTRAGRCVGYTNGVNAWTFPGELATYTYGLPANNTSSDHTLFTFPASAAHYILEALFFIVITGHGGAGAVTITAGTTAGSTEYLASYALTSATAGTRIGVAVIERGTAFAPANDYLATPALGSAVVVRITNSAAGSSSMAVRAFLKGYPLSHT